MMAEMKKPAILRLILVWFAGPMIPLTFTVALFPYIGVFCTFFGGILIGIITARLFDRWFYPGINGAGFSGFILLLGVLLGQTNLERFSLTYAFFEPWWLSIMWLLLAGFIGGLAGFATCQLFSEQINSLGAKINNARTTLIKTFLRRQ
jgi:hypothetical protein